MTVGKLKATFSEVLDDVRNGEEIVIEYGKITKKSALSFPMKSINQRHVNWGS